MNPSHSLLLCRLNSSSSIYDHCDFPVRNDVNHILVNILLLQFGPCWLLNVFILHSVVRPKKVTDSLKAPFDSIKTFVKEKMLRIKPKSTGDINELEHLTSNNRPDSQTTQMTTADGPEELQPIPNDLGSSQDISLDDETGRNKRRSRMIEFKRKMGAKNSISGASNISGRTSALSNHSSLQSTSLDQNQFRPSSVDTVAGFPDLSKTVPIPQEQYDSIKKIGQEEGFQIGYQKGMSILQGYLMAMNQMRQQNLQMQPQFGTMPSGLNPQLETTIPRGLNGQSGDMPSTSGLQLQSQTSLESIVRMPHNYENTDKHSGSECTISSQTPPTADRTASTISKHSTESIEEDLNSIESNSEEEEVEMELLRNKTEINQR